MILLTNFNVGVLSDKTLIRDLAHVILTRFPSGHERRLVQLRAVDRASAIINFVHDETNFGATDRMAFSL